jgi:hypothetical protein
MKNLLTFEEFVNESNKTINEGYTLANAIKDTPDEKEIFLGIAKLLKAKPNQVVGNDDDEGDKKLLAIFREISDWKKVEELSDFDSYYYSKKSNVVKQDAGGFRIYFSVI